MAKIKEFEFKNVRSYGNKMTKIPFDMDNGLILIQGENGHGKTSICEALEYAIYGKSSRVQSKNLPNWFNDNMFTSVKFETDDNRLVSLSRGIAPDFYQIDIEGGQKLDSKDKKSENVSSKPRLDKMVETELFGIPFEVFSNNILLSINDFKSFINMKVADKRKIIDKIFDTDVFNEMLVKLKAELKEYKEKSIGKSSLIDAKEESLKNTNERIEEIKKTVDDSRDEIIESYREKIKELEESLKESLLKEEEAKENLRKNSTEYQDFLTKAKETETEINNKYNALIADIDTKYDNDYKEYQVEIESKKNAELSEIQNDFNKKSKKIVSVEDRTKAITEEINAKISEIKAKCDSDIKDIENSKTKAENVLISKISEKKDTLTAEYNENKSKKDSILAQYEESIKVDNERLTKANDIMKTIEVDKQSTTNSLNFYLQHKCPQCGVDLDHTEFHINKRKELEDRLSQINEKFELIKNKVSEISGEIETKQSSLKKLQEEITQDTLNYNNEIQNVNLLKESKFNELNTLLNEKITDIKHNAEVEIAKLEQNINDIVRNATTEYNAEYNVINSEYSDKTVEINNRYNNLLSSKSNENYDKKNIEKSEAKKNFDETKSKTEEETKSKMSFFIENGSTLERIYKEQNAKTVSIQEKKNNFVLELTKIESSDNIQLLKELTNMSNTLDSELKTLYKENDEILKEISVRENTAFLIGDDGLKKIIMRKILPSFNKMIADITTAFDFKYNFVFDDNFDAHLFVYGKEVPISTSAGEEKIMDIIVLLSTLQMILMKHPTINMLFLDEIFSNLDVKNIAKATSILKDYARKYNIIIFVMSHTTVPQEMFDQIIEVKNDGMFSELQIVK